MSDLRQRMQVELAVRGLAADTQHAYLRSVQELAAYYHLPLKKLDRLSSDDIQRYLIYLHDDRGLTWPTCNGYRSGILFFYRHILKRPKIARSIPRAKEPFQLPVVLSRKDVRALLDSAQSLYDQTLLKVTYNAGLRVTEVTRLRIEDIDSQRMCLRIVQGKLQKDRDGLLSQTLLEDLRHYWRVYRPDPWLFPGQGRRGPLSRTSAHRIFHAAKDRAGITKPGGIHSLRHAFATHLLEAGVDLHTIQRLMGHTSIRSTLRYFHLARGHLLETPSPLDLLDDPRFEDQ
jgi:integrase/recombinase XerD